jgi:O-antigen/teichoic acid export membrane protein
VQETTIKPEVRTKKEGTDISESRFVLPSASKLVSVAYSLLDQGLSVGGGFLVNVALVRVQTKEEYGLFVLSYSVFNVLMGLYTAAVLEPYMVYGAGRYRERFHEYSRLIARGNVWIAASVTALFLTVCWVLSHVAPNLVSRAFLGLALTAGVLLSGHLLRRIFYLQHQPFLAALSSLIYFIVVGCGLIAVAQTKLLNSFSVFLVLAAGWITAAIILGPKLRFGDKRKKFLEFEPNYWRIHWDYSKWVFLTACVFQFTTQGYYWIVAFFLSAKNVAELRAMYILVTPIEQAFIAMVYLIVPALAAHHTAKRIRAYRSLWKRYAISSLVATAVFALLVRAIGRPVVHILYAGKYDTVVPILFLLALLPFLMAIGHTLNSALIAAEKPQLVFFAFVCSGIATFLVGVPLVMRFGVQGAAYGMLLSGTTYTAALALAFMFRVNRHLSAMVAGSQQVPEIETV